MSGWVDFRMLKRNSDAAAEPAAARNWDSPFPVSPSGGKPGRAGSPHAGGHVARPAKSAGTHRAPAPPTRGLPPPCGSPASAVRRAWQLARRARSQDTRVGRNQSTLENRLHEILDTTEPVATNNGFKRE